jgi:hypothetical protein
MTDIRDIELEGNGPFAMPLIQRFERVEMGDGLPYLTLELSLQDGRVVHVPIANRAVRHIAQGLKLALEQKQMPSSGSSHH